VTAVEPHVRGGDFLKSIVYGGMDGIITTFAVVSAVAGGNLSQGTVLIMGVANLLADGISMGVGDFVSSTSEVEYTKSERAREMWECENYLEGEKNEMIEIYAAKKGITEKDAHTIVDIISRDLDTFVDIMMFEELGMLPPEEEDMWDAAKGGAITFGSFLVFGLVPILPYLVRGTATPDARAGVDTTFIVSVALTALTLFGLGAATQRFSVRKWYIAGAFTFANGALAAMASYLIAWGVSEAFDVEI
jgi:DNA damage-binding protein 1